jgi:chromosome segregation ATPase
MKTVDYINALIKEKEELKKLCISHVETIRLQKKEILNLNNTILKKDKKIKSLESEDFENIKNELNKLKIDYEDLQNKYIDIVNKNEDDNKKPQRCKSELSKLKTEYNDLKIKYDDIVQKNKELMQIFDDIESTCDSE